MLGLAAGRPRRRVLFQRQHVPHCAGPGHHHPPGIRRGGWSRSATIGPPLGLAGLGPVLTPLAAQLVAFLGRQRALP